MPLLRRLNNRVTFSAGAGNDASVFPPVTPSCFSWNDFFRGSRGRIAGKIGGTELLALEYSYRWFRPPFPKSLSWRRPAERLYFLSGVFPLEKTQFKTFSTCYQNSIASLDAVYLWQNDPFLKVFEERLVQRLCPTATRLGPDSMAYPAVLGLADLNWLVVSPFVRTMKLQAGRMQEIHPGHARKATFKNLEKRCQFLECPFPILQPSLFRSWSEGLERLTEKALRFQYDILIVGAGAWALPLLAGLKKEGRSGIHLGGETQLLFGIKGKRWDLANIYNRAWIRPDASETPSGTNKIEQGCYW